MQADGVMILFGVATNQRMIADQYRTSCDPLYDKWLQSSFTDMLKTMQAYGPVWLVLPPYDRALGTDSFSGRDAHTDCTNRDLRAAVAAAAPNAAVIDLRSFICPPGQIASKRSTGSSYDPTASTT